MALIKASAAGLVLGGGGDKGREKREGNAERGRRRRRRRGERGKRDLSRHHELLGSLTEIDHDLHHHFNDGQ